MATRAGPENTALAVLIDLFSEDAADLHGSVIHNAPCLAALVIIRFNEKGFVILAYDDPRLHREDGR
jgi:hypothetical protein